MLTEFISYWKELGTVIYLQLIYFIALLFYGITQIYTEQKNQCTIKSYLSMQTTPDTQLYNLILSNKNTHCFPTSYLGEESKIAQTPLSFAKIHHLCNQSNQF